MSVKSLAITLILSIGLLVVLGPKLAHGSNANAELGNCYADTEATSTPTICQ
jgi:hypothetical protein